jgi:hypothetical protein
MFHKVQTFVSQYRQGQFEQVIHQSQIQDYIPIKVYVFPSSEVVPNQIDRL